MQRYWQNYIDGAWVDGGAGRIEVLNPATGMVLAEHALADAADVDRAVQAAGRVHRSGTLRDMRPIERGRMVQAMGRFLIEHTDEIAEVLTLEQGKPLWEAKTEVKGAALYFEYYGNQAATVEGKSVPLGAGYFDWTENEPYGVSAQIIPWNYRLEMTARSMSAGLSTGNACDVKTPEMTPLTNAYLVRAAEAAGFPPGAVNVLCGLGHEAGAALSGHPGVNQIVFTGAVPTGIAIAQAAAGNVVPCVLELGGKSAAIVHDDADLAAFERDLIAAWEDTTTSQVIEATNPSGGREALERLVHRSLADDRALDRAVRAWTLQKPLVAERVARVDVRRIDHIHTLLTKCGLDAQAARDRAQFLYWSYLGRPAKRMDEFAIAPLAAAMVDMLLG